MQNLSISRQRLQHLSKEELIEVILKKESDAYRESVADEWAIYQKIFDESTDALFLTDVENYKILLCNQRSVEIFGLESKDDLLGAFGHEFRLHQSDQPRKADFLEGNEEIEYQSKKGYSFWGLKKVSRIQIKDRIYRLVRITDVTHQKEQEKQRQYTDRLYQTIVNTQKEMVCRFKPDTTITFVNEAYARNLGKTAEELMGKKFLELIPQNEHAWILQRLQQTAKEGKPKTNEHIVKADDGTYRWHQWTDIPIFNESGQLIEFQAVGLDISSRVRMEKRFKESEEKFRTLVMTVPVGIFLTDERGNCNWINRQLEQMFHISFQEALVDGLYQRILDEDKEQIMGIWKGYSGNEQMPFSREGRYSLNQEIRWARFSLTPLRTDQEQVMGYVGIVEDFTERKRYEETLLNTKSELEEAVKAKDEFLSVMSHEIRTPLNSIIGLSQLMAEEQKHSDQYEMVKTVQYSSNQLLTLVNDILDFSKIRAGKLKLEHIPFDLRELFKQSVGLFQNQAREKNITLTHKIDPDVPQYVKGDPTRLGQILNNLLSNAVKFTMKGSVKLQARTLNKDSLLIEIADTGIGMREDEQLKVFKAFTQANSSTNRKFGGTGLGLSITEKLVKLQQGSINFKSKYGEGTTFSVVLPIHPTTKLRPSDKGADVDLKEVQKLRILYVEDVEANQILMRNLCQRWRTHLEMVSSGESALELLRNNTSFDIILMDIMMPGLDGYQTSQKIRKMQGDFYQKVPIVALTASVSNREANKYRRYGMNDFVEKPINSQLLLQKILDNVKLPKRVSPKTAVSENKKSKNMFSLLREYHEQNPEEYVEMLHGTRMTIKKYRLKLIEALKSGDIKQYRQLAHKLINLIMLFEDQHSVNTIRESVNELEKGEDREALEQKLNTAFSGIYENMRQMAQKSKNLLN
jgi:PAS domain S-box-containing protein